MNYPDCTEIEGDMSINGNNISNLNGLSVLTSVGGDLNITATQFLQNLSGLENLIFVGGHMDFRVNSNINSLSGLGKLNKIGGYLRFDENNSLPNLMGLTNLDSIGGNLIISSNNSLINLSGLENVSFIGGSIRIFANDSLISLTGLDNVEAESINDIYIQWNESLENCSVQSICDFLSSPYGAVDIVSNATGCNNPPEIANSCGITLPCLPFGVYYFSTQNDIDNFQTNYPNCTYLEGNVTIWSSNIENLNGLNVITYIGGTLDVFYNSYLDDFTGLENVTSIGDNLYIHDNSGLISLNGLENIAASSITDLYIYDNQHLSYCAVQSICDYLANPNGDFEININDTGCNSPAEVEAECGMGFEEVGTRESQISTYPNPSHARFTIEVKIPLNQGVIAIYSINGHEINQFQITEPKMDFDISYLPAGVYFVRVTCEDEFRMFKVIKY